MRLLPTVLSRILLRYPDHEHAHAKAHEGCPRLSRRKNENSSIGRRQAWQTIQHALDAITFLPPIADADKFICVGKNYCGHLEELKRTDLIKEMPQEPTGFIKTNSCLSGHNADVVRPRDVTALDYEPELVFVIGKPAYRVPKGLPIAAALEYVAGITLLNELTCRDTQKREAVPGSHGTRLSP